MSDRMIFSAIITRNDDHSKADVLLGENDVRRKMVARVRKN